MPSAAQKTVLRRRAHDAAGVGRFSSELELI